VDASLVRDLRLDERRPNVTGTHSRRGDAVGGALERKRPHQSQHSVLRRDVPGLERRCRQRVRRGHCHEPPVAARAQRRPRVFREEERARQEKRDEPVPLLLGKVLHRRDVLEAGIRNDRVQPPEALQSRSHDKAIPVARRQVCILDVDAVHRPAVCLEPLDQRGSDSTCRARHERGLHANGPQRMTLAAHV
jgi:hypothetical protein